MSTLFTQLVTHMVETGASDLHLTVGAPPMVRRHGRLRPVPDQEKLGPAECRELVYGLLNTDQRRRLETERQVDFAYPVPALARFRVNAFQQRGSIGAALRMIPARIQELEELGMPPVLRQFTRLPRGFVLVTGPTGSGKSTTLAAMLDVINREREEHILTIEDPIEFLHRHQRCIVNQRELGQDAATFELALKAALRQDPDVILVGEMRDIETMSTALTAAETGHLVFATLHTQDAAQTIDRIIDAFPAAQQAQIRTQLSVALQGVVSQQLLPTADGTGRVCASEVLVPTPAVRNLIREAKTYQIPSAMQTSRASGMQTMDASLAKLVLDGSITRTLAERRSSTPAEMARLIDDPASGAGAAPDPALQAV